jgi:hypothetical protein
MRGILIPATDVKFVLVIAVGLAGLLALLFALDGTPYYAVFTREHGVLEIASAVCAALAGASGMLLAQRARSYGWLVFGVLLLAAAAREMDWHKAWTTMSILKTRFYITETVPVVEKIIGGAVVLVLLIAAFYVARRVPGYWRQWRAGCAPVWQGFSALSLLMIAKLCDASSRLFPNLKTQHADVKTFLTLLEEALEFCAFAILLWISIAAMRRRFKEQREAPGSSRATPSS